jgi:signal transduction histidine kinase
MDVGKMERVFGNLISNAIKFTEEGSVTVGLRIDAARAYIEISDTGPGISKEERDKVFNRYYQGYATAVSSHGGSGIGLSFVKEVVTAHNGDVWVDSDGQRGSCFTVALPLAQDVEITGEHRVSDLDVREEALKGSVEVPYPDAVPGDVKVNRPSILVVEDNPEVAQVIVAALENSYNVYFAKHGLEGLEHLKVRNVQCILSDLMMPKMDGKQFLAEVKKNERWRVIPFVCLTSMSDMETMVECLQLGANNYVNKPFRREVLQSTVKTLVENSTFREQLVVRDKLAAIGTLTTGLCHEIRNPLNNIGAAVIRLRLESGQDVNGEILAAIEQDVDRADRIIRDLLRSSQRDSLELQTCCLKDLTEAARDYSALNQHPGIEFRSDIPPDVYVRCYPNQMKQVFSTVFLNAVQAMGDQGTLELSADIDSGRVRISIEDDGVGITEEVRQRAFDPFFTTKQNGPSTGLGLTIAQSVMLRHGGSIDIRARSGKGSVVMVELEGWLGEEKRNEQRNENQHSPGG